MLDIQKNFFLAPFTTFKIGGPAKEFVRVKNRDELIEVLRYAKENSLKFYVLGGGSNVFFDDRGFDGLVVKMESSGKIELSEDGSVEVWAGESLGSVVNFARDNSLADMEGLSGIPGTVGGAVRGNAGAFGVNMGDLVEQVEVINKDDLEIKTLGAEDCRFSYRRSLFKDEDRWIVISSKLKLKKGRQDEIDERMKKIAQERSEKLPTGWVGSAGSFFENPVVEKKELLERFEKETGAKITDGKIPAGWLIGEAGLRGKKIGGAMVNEKHANFVVNIGGATAQDVVMMSSFIKQQVRDELGVQLREEVSFCGY
jgi:UDP-N-acetylmuramate dehydrogenase